MALQMNIEKTSVHYIRYPNHRLYDVVSSQYTTFSDIYKKISSGLSIQVTDRQTGKDVTREVLIGIIIHICSKSEAIFSEHFLRFIILDNQNPSKLVIQQYFQFIFSTLENVTEKKRDDFHAS
jgi:polyhydroxyalkanoate synthesis repressor PhaR